MANEITITSRLAANKGGNSVSNATSSFTLSMDTAASNMYHSNINVTTTAAIPSMGSVDTSKDYWLWARNTDTTSVITLSSDSGGSNKMGMMKPGEPWGPVRILGGVSVYFDADVATSVTGLAGNGVEIIAVEVKDP